MLSDVQLFNLVLVKEIDEICRKYGIEYYLAGGSVIGALRHKGFIPWDDDMDLYMTRDNWLRFREAFEAEKPADRALESSDINPNYPNMIAKYTSTNTTAIYKNLLSGNYAAGIIVDILILDPVPGDEASRQEHLKNLLMYSEFVNRYYVFLHRFDVDVDFEAELAREKEIGHEALVREYEALVTQYSEEESDTYVLRWGGVPHFFKKELFGKPKLMPFEGIMLPVPEKSFIYLSQLYGEDWIQLPTVGDARSHEAVFSTTRSYDEFFEEFSPHFDESSYLKTVMERKRNRIRAGRSYRAVQDATLEFECRKLEMLCEKAGSEDELRALYDNGKYDDLLELYADYFDGQCNSRMFGNKYFEGVHRYSHPKFADIGDGRLWIAIELLCRQGRLHHPKRLLEAREFNRGQLSSALSEQKHFIDEMISIIDAFEQKRFDEVIMRTTECLIEKPDWINFIKLKILALQRSNCTDLDAIRSLADAGEKIAPEDGDWAKYKGDTYVESNPTLAEELYELARAQTRNGESLLGIDEYFGPKEAASSEQPDEQTEVEISEESSEIEEDEDQCISIEDLTDVQRVYFNLMCEIADICDAAGITYFLSNRSALHAAVDGSVPNEATSPTILLHVEDSLKFVEGFNNAHYKDRYLDSMLTNNKFPTFSFRYIDTNTLCLSTRQLGNFQYHGIYVHIAFIEHVPPKTLRRFASMLKTGWYDINSLHARGKSLEEKSQLAQRYVGVVFNPEADTAVGARLFKLLKKIYSGHSGKYQYNDTALKRMGIRASFIEDEQEQVLVCGRAFKTYAHLDEYLKQLFGKNYEKAAQKTKQLSVYRIVDASISFDEYRKRNDDILSNTRYMQDILENRTYNALNLKYSGKINEEWRIALFVGDKWEFEERYSKERELIDSLYEQADFEGLEPILLPYINHYLTSGLKVLPFYDAHLLDICEVFLRETNRVERFKTIVSKRKIISLADIKFLSKRNSLAKRYSNEQEEIEDLYMQGDFDTLSKMLMPYIRHYTKPRSGMEPFSDAHLLDICEVSLFETDQLEELKRLLAKRQRVERLQRNKCNPQQTSLCLSSNRSMKKGSDVLYYVNENIAKTERIFPEQGRADYVRLDMNENPIGLPEDVVAQIREAVTPSFLARYPEPGAFIQKYADFIGVNPDQLCVTNGSDNAIRYVMQTFARPGKDVVTVHPTFEMYMVNCWLLGLNHKTVSYEDDFTIDIDKLIAAIDEDTDMVILVNPNNPLGNVYNEQDVRRIIQAANEHAAMVVIDEAYHYFTPCTYLNLINEFDNVIVLRTFSKCFSLAGVRLGVAISNKQVAHYLNNLRLSFEVNTVALKCGEVVLDTPGLIQNLADIQIAGREYVVENLKALGYKVLTSESNFVSFEPKQTAQEVDEKLRDRGILVKTFGGGLLKGWIRINTGSIEVMKEFIDALREVDTQ